MKGDTQNGFRLKGWQVYPLRNLLVGPRGEIHIEPKVMQVLESLASNPGQVVERETLLKDIWDGRAFSDEPLTRCIAALRHALDDDPHDPEYIQTIPKRGYRLVCPVESLEEATDDVTDDLGNRGRRRIALTAFLGLIVIAAVVVIYRSTLISPIESPQLSVEGTTQSEPSRYSIAVLPFRNRSAVAEDAFFVDGIHDDILIQLAKLSSLDKVISRTSVERYRETTKPLQQIGQELAVATILEGGVQRAGDQVRINAQLIDAQTDEHLWAETYDRELTVENLFAIQSEISREIVGALQLVLTDEENARLKVMPTISLEAHNEFVLGHREMAKRTAEALFQAQAHFENAIELDPNYALAYVGLADSLTLQFVYGFLKFEDGFLKFADSLMPRQSAIDRALELDPMSGEAYTSLAQIKVTEMKHEEAEKYFLKGIYLSPNYATAHHWYAMYLRGSGRYEEALPHIRKAIEFDPMVPALTATLGSLLWDLGRVEEAQAALLKGIGRNPEFPRFYTTMSSQLLALGRIGEAVNWFRAATRLAPSNFRLVVFECYLYLELAADQLAERCYDSVEDSFGERAFGRRLDLYLFRSQMGGEAAKLIEQLAQRDLGHYMMNFLARLHFLNGEADKARSIWQDLWPELYGDEDIIVKANEMLKHSFEMQTIVYVAYTLYVDGQLDRADYLFDHALETMQSMHRVRGIGYDEMDVFIHAMRGEKRKAIAALREAIDMGWRRGWWVLRSPLYDSMREEPEWVGLVNELEADIARQRQWYENHKDDPLF
ncbi:MAG: winged helix-turn-helix domain-containing protein [Proteobacteria bacterium]|nr:winged helix-turn-helix domain-containing protein [Pseudomonadota bacterium]